MNIESVLDEVHQVTLEYHQMESERETIYNIFEVLEISDREVLMCRVLADLLNPVGAHGQGSRYLASFLKEVLRMPDMPEDILAQTKVYKEFVIDENQRIDIVIKNERCFIPMEVKIHAGDKKSQCYDYYSYARQRDTGAKVVYLTKWGDMPDQDSIYSEDGSRRVPEEDIVRISFAEDISQWLKARQRYADGVMHQVIAHYQDAINSFTCVPNEELKNMIVDKVLETEDRFRAALCLSDAMNKIKAELIYLVMEEFEAQMSPLLDRYNLEKEKDILWYDYKQQATEQFYRTYSTYPGIDYVVKDAKLPHGYELWLRIEIENNLFAGFCVFDPNAQTDEGVGAQVDEMEDALKAALIQVLNIDKVNNTSWWALYRYLPTGAEHLGQEADEIPNFKHMNEAAIRLADADKRKEFVSLSVKRIEEALLALVR